MKNQDRCGKKHNLSKVYQDQENNKAPAVQVFRLYLKKAILFFVVLKSVFHLLLASSFFLYIQ